MGASINPEPGTLSPNAIVGQACSYTFTFTPTDPSYTLSDITITNAPSDPGLTFTPGTNPPQGGTLSGALSGTPTLVATYSTIDIACTVTTLSGSAPTSLGPYTLIVTPAGNYYTAPQPLPGASFPNGTQNVPATGLNSVQVAITGSASLGPDAYYVNTIAFSGAPDPGLSVTADRAIGNENDIIGTITGTPTIIATYTNIYANGTITTAGNTYDYSWGPYSWSVVAENVYSYMEIEFIPNPLPNGIESVPYGPSEILLGATNGSFVGAPSVTGLPTGLSYTATPSSGILYIINITGTPPLGSAGTYSSIFIPGVLNSFSSGKNLDYNFGPYTIVISPLCIASNTEILMSDGSVKLIQDIKRGDLVASNTNIDTVYKVARTLFTIYPNDSIINMCSIQPNSININNPYKTLLLTPCHSIIHNNIRRPAEYFTNINGIDFIKNTKVQDLLPIDTDGSYSLWDIQFETIGSYVANGVVVQSRHPQSFITPLPKELYFTESLYRSDTQDDNDPLFQYPLVFDYIATE